MESGFSSLDERGDITASVKATWNFRDRANQKIWVIEPPTASAAAKIYSFPVASLPASLNAVKDQWMATSLLFVQDKDTLYIAGGYGENSNHELVTYPLLSAVNLPALVQGVVAGKESFLKDDLLCGIPACTIDRR